MLGWHISVYRQERGGTAPAERDTKAGPRLAVWQGDLDSLKWLDELVHIGVGLNLGGNGYPMQYTAKAEHLIPQIIGGPPRAHERWVCSADDVITDKWEGRTIIDAAVIASCQPSEWLLIAAWDES